MQLHSQKEIMEEDVSLQKLKQLKGKKIEIIAFNISYQGVLESFDLEGGTLKLVEGDDYVILEIERIESIIEVLC